MVTGANTLEVVLGVDTHLDIHVGVVVNHLGHVLGTLNHCPGLSTITGLGTFFRHTAIEGTGTYGAALAHHLSQQGITVLEVNRPDRSRRRRRGKSDPTNAESAARVVLSQEARASNK